MGKNKNTDICHKLELLKKKKFGQNLNTSNVVSYYLLPKKYFSLKIAPLEKRMIKFCHFKIVLAQFLSKTFRYISVTG